MTGIDGIDEVVLNLHGHLRLRCFHLFCEELNTTLDVLELIFEVIFPVSHQFLQVIHILLRQCQHHFSLERDGVAHITTMPGSQTGFAFLDGLSNEAYHHLIGIATTFVDLQTRMTATQSFQSYLHGYVIGIRLHLFIFKRCGNINTTSRADHELTPCLGVEVHQDITVQLTFGQCIGTKHTRLFISGDQCLYRTVLQRLVLHDCHDGSHTESVVSTEGGSLCFHPFAVDPRFDGISHEVVLTLGRLLRHHIHVGLQDHTLTVLHTRRRRLAHHDVVGRIFEGFHASFLCKLQQELLYFL